MAACISSFSANQYLFTAGIGASGLKVTNFDFGCFRPKLSTLQPLLGFGTPNSVRSEGLVLSQRSKKASTRRHRCNSDGDSPSTADTVDCSEEIESSDAVSKLIPTSSEVEYLLTELCDTTSIAQFELKLRGFRLNVKRDLSDQSAPPQPPVSAHSTAHKVYAIPDSNGSILSHSKALVPSSGGVQEFLDRVANEGLLMIRSPRVGFFRRSWSINNKKLPPACKEKDQVREGQALCYIEQLGAQIPVKSSVAGEVVKILLNDGDPVGYDDSMIALLPSFPGIKKLQR